MKKIKTYSFELRGEHDTLIMSTEIDNEPDPRSDQEFWERFLKGDCVMEYTGCEEILEEDND